MQLDRKRYSLREYKPAPSNDRVDGASLRLGTSPQSDARVSIVPSTSFKPEPVKWLWPGWLALSKLHLLAGTAGTGKTTIAVGIAAAITTGGKLPDGADAPLGSVLPTPRPGTHELTGDVLSRFDVDIVAVRLVGRAGGIYFAELDLRGRDRHSIHACRPSDGLTLALRQAVPAPILVDLRLWEPDGDVEPASPAA